MGEVAGFLPLPNEAPRVQLLQSKTRYAAVILAVALLACLVVGVLRIRTERHARRVEIAMDYTDFAQLARSFDYRADAFLIALRRAGLTSLAVSEQLGSNLGSDGSTSVLTGAQILNGSRLAALSDPLLSRLARERKIDGRAVYLLIGRRSTYNRLRIQLPLHFMPKSIHVLRAQHPWLIEIHTQIDYFNAIGLGIPTQQILLAKRLGLLLIPRLQNDERFKTTQMNASLNAILELDPKVSTVIFFGLKNQVFGYPDHIPDAAKVFKSHSFNFGTIEVYDVSQLQKGNNALAQLIPGRSVRVQTVQKTDLDRLSVNGLIDRFMLGVRERNIRVIYLHPYPHRDKLLSIEATNVEIVHRLDRAIAADGLRLGTATPIPLYPGTNRVLVGIVALAVPSIFVLLLGAFGLYRPSYAALAYAATLALYVGGVLVHRADLARSMLALLGGLLFVVAAMLAYAPACSEEPKVSFPAQWWRSLTWALIVIGTVLLGALVVVGLLSTPLAMEEIEPFRGVKLMLALPPLIALLLYVFDPRFKAKVGRATDVLLAPVRAYHLIVIAALVGAATVLLLRSGNTSDIGASHLELMVRQDLSAWLSVRPRFKQFLIGIPAAMLLPALTIAHRRAIGWLCALGIGVGLGDAVDTFSHLHTPLLIAVMRIGNDFLVGAIVGAASIALYRFVARHGVVSS